MVQYIWNIIKLLQLCWILLQFSNSKFYSESYISGLLMALSTHCGLVTIYGDIELGNIDLSSKVSCPIHLRVYPKRCSKTKFGFTDTTYKITTSSRGHRVNDDQEISRYIRAPYCKENLLPIHNRRHPCINNGWAEVMHISRKPFTNTAIGNCSRETTSWYLQEVFLKICCWQEKVKYAKIIWNVQIYELPYCNQFFMTMSLDAALHVQQSLASSCHARLRIELQYYAFLVESQV